MFPHVITAVTLFLFTLGLLVILGLSGGFLLLPFRRRFLYLAAPLAGIMIQAISTGVLYSFGHLSFRLSILIGLTSCPSLLRSASISIEPA